MFESHWGILSGPAVSGVFGGTAAVSGSSNIMSRRAERERSATLEGQMLKAIVLCTVILAAVSCGDDSSSDSVPEGSAIETPENFPVVFPEGGEVSTVDEAGGSAPFQSVVVVYADGELHELAGQIRSQLPADANETSGQGQISMVSDQVIVNLSEQSGGVWISVSAL
jgi:hypothetical protein